MEQGKNQQSTNFFQQIERRINFNDLLAMLIANKWLIALSTTVFLLLGVIHAVLRPNTYSASLLLQVHSVGNVNLLSKSTLLPVFSNGGASPEDIQAVLIKSPYVLEPVIRQLGLASTGHVRDAAQSLSDQLKISDLGSLYQIAPNTGVLQISLTGVNAHQVVSILNTIADFAVQKNLKNKSTQWRHTLGFLKKELVLVKKSLEKATLSLSEYEAKTGIISLTANAQSLMSQIEHAKKTLYEIQLEKALALQKYTAVYPTVLALTDKEKEAQGQLKRLEFKQRQLPAKERTEALLLNDVKIKNELYMLLLDKVQSVEIIQAGTASDIRVLDYAKMPSKSDPAHTIRMLLSCVIIGAGLAIFFVVFRNMIHTKIVDPEEIAARYGLPNLAIIPYSNDQANIMQAYDAKTELLPLVAKIMPHSLAMEALRSFRTGLKISMMEAKNNIITISGISPGVGKSFIAANFAFLLANTDKKILLIDGDLRKGYLKSYFKLGDFPGLSEFLAGINNIEKILLKNVYPNLDFIAAGQYPGNPSELLLKPHLQEMLQLLSARYDLIIIDTPPILAVTDAAIIGEHTGGNFIVFASGTHEIKEVDLALKRFSASNIKMDGFIFNINSADKGLYRQYTSTYQYQYEYK